jgi:hypothetical protein
MDRKKLKKAVDEFKIWCKKFRNPVLKRDFAYAQQIAWIMGHVKSKIQGIINYFSLPGNERRHKELVTLFQRALFYWLNPDCFGTSLHSAEEVNAKVITGKPFTACGITSLKGKGKRN